MQNTCLTELLILHSMTWKIQGLSSTCGIKFKDFQVPVLFSSTFKPLNLEEKIFKYFQGCVGTLDMAYSGNAYLQKRNEYVNGSLQSSFKCVNKITVKLVDTCKKLNTGEVCGPDDSVAENLQYAHSHQCIGLWCLPNTDNDTSGNISSYSRTEIDLHVHCIGSSLQLIYWTDDYTVQNAAHKHFWYRLPIFQVDLHCVLHRVATSSCNGNVDELATEPFLLLHREHGTGYRRSWNCCYRRTRFVVIWKHFCFILSTSTRIWIDSVIRTRSSSRGRYTTASVTVTVTKDINKHQMWWRLYEWDGLTATDSWY